MNTRVFILLLCVVLSSACSKKDDTPLSPKLETTSKLLGRWQMTRVTLTDVSGGVNERESCESDNIYEFKNDNVFTNDPQVLCEDNRDEWGTGDYEVSEDGKSYNLLYAGNVIKVVKIKELTPDRLVLNWLDARGNFPYDYTYTFERIQ